MRANTMNEATKLYLDRVPSEIGIVFVISDGAAICAVDFENYESRMHELLTKQYPTFELIPKRNPLGVSDRLQAYFEGDLTALDEIPVNPGGTDFQREVWLNLRSIPPGKTITYGQLADQLRKPKSARAVGMTNSLNPISIILPCHRVIGANGKLTGYAGGLDRKRWLLHHEGWGQEEVQLALLFT
jgi:methylated-DNA-[protein]-cysteine S-methyltransferase